MFLMLITGCRQNQAQAAAIIERQKVALGPAVQSMGADIGAQMFVRIFKKERELEVWLKNDSIFSHFRTYPIEAFSGTIGPKLQEGDHQAPEGFYSVTHDRLNPRSRYHLAVNIGFPNEYDRAHGRTGSFIMVHGSNVSIGCYAMTDPVIEEIYTLADSALSHGQGYVQVHCFPFRMTSENMTRHADSEWIDFWKNLKDGYDWFEKHQIPPNVVVKNKHYHFTE